jgi:hypothetical protein
MRGITEPSLTTRSSSVPMRVHRGVSGQPDPAQAGAVDDHLGGVRGTQAWLLLVGYSTVDLSVVTGEPIPQEKGMSERSPARSRPCPSTALP